MLDQHSLSIYKEMFVVAVEQNVPLAINMQAWPLLQPCLALKSSMFRSVLPSRSLDLILE